MNLNITQFQLIVNVGKHVLVFLAHSCLFLLAIFLVFFFLTIILYILRIFSWDTAQGCL